MQPNVGEISPEQTTTLQHVREISRYNDWVFSYLQPYLRDRVLELGCGIGTYSARLRARAHRLTCLDKDPGYVATVAAMFRDDPKVVVMNATLGEGLEFAPGSFDAVLCLNVLEHIEHDRAALDLVRSWLAPGGVLMLQVPAHQWLFGSIDTALGHWRRYTRRQLADVLVTAGFELVMRPRYLYALAIPGWWWCGRVRALRVVPEGTVRIANALARLSRVVETVVPLPMGLTLVAAARARDRL